MVLDWYFDFISPFAYLQHARLAELPPSVQVRLQPVLFAGILAHWGQLGPAEIAPKRRFTYRHVTWLAQRAGLPFRMPAGHPFNSLPLLRLAWLLDPSPALVARLFHYVWGEGHIPQQASPWRALLEELGVADDAALAAARQPLRAATDAAVAQGVFGVPTAVVGGELFWGYDATDLLLAYCADPAVLDSDAMRAADAVPVAAMRRPLPAAGS